jgi:hypothetical protein
VEFRFIETSTGDKNKYFFVKNRDASVSTRTKGIVLLKKKNGDLINGKILFQDRYEGIAVDDPVYPVSFWQIPFAYTKKFYAVGGRLVPAFSFRGNGRYLFDVFGDLKISACSTLELSVARFDLDADDGYGSIERYLLISCDWKWFATGYFWLSPGLIYMNGREVDYIDAAGPSWASFNGVGPQVGLGLELFSTKFFNLGFDIRAYMVFSPEMDFRMDARPSLRFSVNW